MRLPSWLNFWRPASSRVPSQRQRRHRPCLEPLEDRTLLSSYTAASVSDLVTDINAANQGAVNTIALRAGAPFTLGSVDNTTDGPTGLPVIAANDNLTIVGNGDVIARSSAAYFRLFDVAGGAALTLQNLTVQGGLEYVPGMAAAGGAIYNQGTLTLNGVTVQNNTAQGQAAEGGAIYNQGTLTLNGGTVQGNTAQGSNGASGSNGGAGGSGIGGGVYVAGGTATFTDVNLSGNEALGGQGGVGSTASTSHGGNGGSGSGGGLYVASGTVTLTSATRALLSGNTAQGGKGGSGGNAGAGGSGSGGGLYLASGTAALTNIDLSGNTAQGGQGSDSTFNAGRAGQRGGFGGSGGSGFGGGLYVAGDETATLTNVHLSGNSALGGAGGRCGYAVPDGNGGNGFGGGLYAAGGSSVHLISDTVKDNKAKGGIITGSHASAGLGEGGGLYIDPLAVVSLDDYTKNHVTHNTATPDPDADTNIHGTPS